MCNAFPVTLCRLLSIDFALKNHMMVHTVWIGTSLSAAFLHPFYTLLIVVGFFK